MLYQTLSLFREQQSQSVFEHTYSWVRALLGPEAAEAFEMFLDVNGLTYVLMVGRLDACYLAILEAAKNHG